MDVASSVVAWLTDPTHWAGPDGIPNRLFEHLELTALAVLVALAIALPIGLAIGHTGRGAVVAVSVANIGRAVPSYALLLMLLPIFGLGFWTGLVALVFLAIPPILTNTYAGLREVDRDLVDAGRGLGMSGLQLLRRVEVPVALPVIAAGIRTATVQVVATVGLVALIAGGTLGRYVVDGFALQDDTRMLAGALLIAALAILTEQVLGRLEQRLVSPGLGPADEARPFTTAGEVPHPTERSL